MAEPAKNHAAQRKPEPERQPEPEPERQPEPSVRRRSLRHRTDGVRSRHCGPTDAVAKSEHTAAAQCSAPTREPTRRGCRVLRHIVLFVGTQAHGELWHKRGWKLLRELPRAALQQSTNESSQLHCACMGGVGRSGVARTAYSERLTGPVGLFFVLTVTVSESHRSLSTGRREDPTLPKAAQPTPSLACTASDAAD